MGLYEDAINKQKKRLEDMVKNLPYSMENPESKSDRVLHEIFTLKDLEEFTLGLESLMFAPNNLEFVLKFNKVRYEIFQDMLKLTMKSFMPNNIIPLKIEKFQFRSFNFRIEEI
jgi:hypothetical protein